MSNPVATLYIYRRAGRVVGAGIGQVPPEPPMGWETLTRIPISNNGRPPWRTFTVRCGHEGQDFARRHWSGDVAGDPPDLAAPAGAGGRGHRGHRRPKHPPLPPGEGQGEGPRVGDTITYNGRQCRVLAITGDGHRAFIRDLATRQAMEIDLPISQEKGTCR
jgi:hypothetical protein